MKLLSSVFLLWVTTTSSYGCSTLTEGWESVVDCSNVTDISEVAAYMDELSASFSVFHSKFRILNNADITSLPDGLFGDIQFITVEISGCPALSEVGDFLGATSGTISTFIFWGNNYPYVPALNAPHLLNLTVYGGNSVLLVERSAFARMQKIEVASLHTAEIRPMAFFDLKNLRTLYIPFTASSFTNLTAGTLQFDSPSLQSVKLPGSYFPYIEYGSIEGFTSFSGLLLRHEYDFTKDAFYNLLNGGSKLVIDRSTVCNCNVAWIRLGPFLHQTEIVCSTMLGNILLQGIPAEEFADCEVL